MMRYYKVTGPDGEAVNGGSGSYFLPKGRRPGRWMPRVEKIEVCRRGYHLVTRNHLFDWIGKGNELYLAEGRGKSDSQDGKKAFEQARLLRRLPGFSQQNMERLALACMDRMLPTAWAKRPNKDVLRLMEVIRSGGDPLGLPDTCNRIKRLARNLHRYRNGGRETTIRVMVCVLDSRVSLTPVPGRLAIRLYHHMHYTRHSAWFVKKFWEVVEG